MLAIHLELVGLFGLVKIVCQFRRDFLSVSLGALKSILCVDVAKSSLEFGSDLKNLHRGGECRERAKTKLNRVFLTLC